MEVIELYPNYHIYYIYENSQNCSLDELIVLQHQIRDFMGFFFKSPPGVTYFVYIRDRDNTYSLVIHFSSILYEDYIQELRRTDARDIYFGGHKFKRSTYFGRTKKPDMSVFGGDDVVQIISRCITNWTYNVENIRCETRENAVTFYVTMSVTAYGIKIFQRTFKSTFADHANFDYGSHYKMAVSFSQVKWLDIFLLIKREERYYLCVRDEYIRSIPPETVARIINIPNVGADYEFLDVLFDTLRGQHETKMEEIRMNEGDEEDMYGKYIIATDLSKRTEK